MTYKQWLSILETQVVYRFSIWRNTGTIYLYRQNEIEYFARIKYTE